MKAFTYKIHLEAEPEGGYTVTVPALAGCVTWGKDYGHAIEMAQECIQGFLESLAEVGEPIPEPDMTPESEIFIRVEATVHT